MKHHSKEAETSKPTMRSVGANYEHSIVTNHLIIPITVWQCTKICKLCLSNSKITNFSLTKFLTYISYHLLAWYILIQENKTVCKNMNHMKFEINGKTKKSVSHYIGCRQLTKALEKVQELSEHVQRCLPLNRLQTATKALNEVRELSEHVQGCLPLNRLQTATKALDEVWELLLSKHVHVKCTYSKLV